MLGLISGKAVAYLAGALLSGTVLTHGGQPYSPKPYTNWLGKFSVPSPPGYVDFGIGGCSSGDDAGCMDWTFPIATVRVTRADRLDKSTFAHEMGHVFDFYVLRPIAWRDRFAELEGFPWTTPRSEEYFADSYALCALYRRLRRTVTTGYGFRVTPALHRRICSLVRDAYAQWLLSPPLSPPGQMLPAPVGPAP
jgi:hypothetical protein